MSTIIIPVDANTAKLYAEASKDTPAKLQFLLRLWLREYLFSTRSLPEIMDEIGRKAEQRGLTPEILDSLLSAE
jgi:hypothetical protein